MLVCDVVLCPKGERRAGAGTGAMVEGSPGKQWNEGVNRKYRVHMSEWNARRKYQYAIFELPQVTELKCMGGTYPVANGDINL